MSSVVTDSKPTLSAEPAPMPTTQTVQEHGQIEEPNTAPTSQDSAQPPIVPFKERVIGVAKKTRGTLLGKPELKEHGEKILQGEASIHDEPRSS
ncbi:hypothetical protein B0H17DRAFT_1208348 [Mycena rosella]|uniref:Uncharacterized protein n=1 Tax=Mycena rosella TaxID=1033263 RepID=A0AAD7D4S8_MYCRO|nr:hypothetical protein B0H17DRAFT_1208348 [Mycena rosella]